MASATHHPGRFGHIYFHTDNHDLDTILIPTIVTQPFVEPEIVSNRTSWGSLASATHYAGRFRHIYFHTDNHDLITILISTIVYGNTTICGT